MAAKADLVRSIAAGAHLLRLRGGTATRIVNEPDRARGEALEAVGMN
jgi:hypothetical protein